VRRIGRSRLPAAHARVPLAVLLVGLMLVTLLSGCEARPTAAGGRPLPPAEPPAQETGGTAAADTPQPTAAPDAGAADAGATDAGATGAGAADAGATGAGAADAGTSSAAQPTAAAPTGAEPATAAPAPAASYRPPATGGAPMAERVEVRGIYVTQYIVAHRAAFERLLDLVERTELNAMVINAKDDDGRITFAVDHPVALAAGAATTTLGDIRPLLADLEQRGIYTIARVVTFKDSLAAGAFPEMAVRHAEGGIWRDFAGAAWLDPYNRAAWDYNVAIAKAAARVGFKEIQFDYVRFPSDGYLSTAVYPARDERERARAIAGFLAYAREELRPYGVWVSADIFGLVTAVRDDMGIGQILEEVAAAVDYLCPMLYPSHYTPGNLGVPNPNAMPYETVYRSLLGAAERLAEFPDVIVRPWLQDFSLGHRYGPEEVRNQIQAVYDAGYREWMLWNAANIYTEGALRDR
jgi:hypothetical protein